ncbi:MAG TPA: helix-turn-helix domain-containing protein [Xanthobacteraceae bacterium]|nr:helix-turn-helix domain-containing protein [Xanthobacteraceae bacterium]
MLSRVPAEHPESSRGLRECTSLSPIRAILTYRKAETIYSETDRADHWYCVLKGAARKYTVLSDGRRQIVDFLLPGDYFGFRERHHCYFATDALLDGTTVARYPRHSVEAAADSDPALSRQIREVVLDSMSRSQARLLIMGRIRSIEKVGAFLWEMADRCLDRREQTIVLPMSRYDIADYLALSVETVSRALTRLRHEGAIRFVDKHRISILDSHHLLGTSMLIEDAADEEETCRARA